jgi:iron complex transport system ATP-binding protein
MSAALLSLQDVAFGYDAAQPPVIASATFDLQPRRITAIVGPNGAGKTTLLSVILGWLKPWRGEILLDGQTLHHRTRADRGRQIALVPQSEHTPFDYSVLEYVLLGRAPHLPQLGVPALTDYEIALASLDSVGLADLADRPVPQLSGGERQLMLLARALTQQPRLLILDEPTAHLDLHNKHRLIEILRRLRNQGVTLLMTNHEPDVVLAAADDVVVMERGQPPLFGSLTDMFTSTHLSRIYRLPIHILDVDGRRVVSWT